VNHVVKLSLRTHPEVLFSYKANYVELISRVENHSEHPLWAEADVIVPEKLSLSPSGSELRKGRVRIGIVGKNEFLEKAVRIYGNGLTAPQMYHCSVILYIFNGDGVIDKRMEKSIDLRCEPKKEATL